METLSFYTPPPQKKKKEKKSHFKYILTCDKHSIGLPLTTEDVHTWDVSTVCTQKCINTHVQACRGLQTQTQQTHTHTHTHTHTCNRSPNRGRWVWHTVYTIRILHAIGDGTLWCTTCNRGRFVYEYDSSLITGDVKGAHKFSSFVNIIYIRFAIDCTNSQGGDRPRFQNVPGLNVECHTYVPSWRRLQTHTHTHLNGDVCFKPCKGRLINILSPPSNGEPKCAYCGLCLTVTIQLRTHFNKNYFGAILKFK